MEFFDIELQSGLISRRSGEELMKASGQALSEGKVNKALRLRKRAGKRLKIEQYQNAGLL